jgi:hypothetical protein
MHKSLIIIILRAKVVAKDACFVMTSYWFLCASRSFKFGLRHSSFALILAPYILDDTIV